MKHVSLSCERLNPNSSVAISTANAREWWAAESVKLGSDWLSLAETVTSIMYQLAAAIIVMGGFIMSACSVCGSEPCTNPSFCATCRDADRRNVHGQPPRYIEASRWRGPPNHIPRNWNEISLEALIAHFDGARPRSGAPQPTVEALMYALRKGGSALNESSNLRRLGELSEPQLHEVCARLQKFKTHIARAWTPAEIEALVVTWTEVKNG